MDTDSAIKLLFKNRRLFLACYNPVEESTHIDFTTGSRAGYFDIKFGEGCIVRRQELKSFARRSSADELTMMSSRSKFLVLENPKFEVSLKSKIVVHGQPHAIAHIHDSSYANYKVLEIEHLIGENVFQDEVRVFHCSDQMKCYLDKLCCEIKRFYAGVVPADLSVHPVVGFDAASSLRLLFPKNDFAAIVGIVDYKEVGRLSGYKFADTTSILAKNLVQTSDPAIQHLVDAFNTLMGRT